MIAFVEKKLPDYAYIQEVLADSYEQGHWSNFAPASRKLEDRIHSLLGLPSSQSVVCAANGSLALLSLIRMYNHLEGRELRWVVCSFTFWCQRLQELGNSIVLDCAQNGFLSFDALNSLSTDNYDGIIVTNMFGKRFANGEYTRFARERGKYIIFDSATAFYSAPEGEPFGGYGDSEIFSFHHTKPLGFGEGGAAIVPRQHEKLYRSLISFGLFAYMGTSRSSTNAKMADTAAAFVLDRLRGVEVIREVRKTQWQRLEQIASSKGLELLVRADESTELPSLVPVLSAKEVTEADLANEHLVLKKYYVPIGQTNVANSLYKKIVCFPCHRDLERLSDSDLSEVFDRVFFSSRNLMLAVSREITDARMI